MDAVEVAKSRRAIGKNNLLPKNPLGITAKYRVSRAANAHHEKHR